MYLQVWKEVEALTRAILYFLFKDKQCQWHINSGLVAISIAPLSAEVQLSEIWLIGHLLLMPEDLGTGSKKDTFSLTVRKVAPIGVHAAVE